MPPDLYLSKNECRQPIRVCVLSIPIVAIRILYNINGFGVWEQISSITSCRKMKDDVSEESGSPVHDKDGSETESATKSSVFVKTEFNTEELLKNLEAKYHEVAQSYEHEKDLLAYILHGKDVVFAGSEEFSRDDVYKNIKELWNQYLIDKGFKGKRAGNIDIQFETPSKKRRSQDDSLSLHQLSSEENGFSDEGHRCSPSKTRESVTRIVSDQEQASTPGNHTSPEEVRERNR